jgi:hypothetical protein
MASLLVCVQPATGHPDGFLPAQGPAALLKQLAARPQLSRVTPAARLEVRPAPETASTGIAEIDALTGGLPRGCLTEIYGPASSGRTGFLLSALAAATRRQEACALIDVSDAFHPQSGWDAGINFHNLLWVRCDADFRSSKDRKSSRKSEREQFFISPDGRLFSNAVHKTWQNCLEQALKATDLLLQSGGFGLVAIDLSDVPVEAVRRIPLTSWFRFRRAVEKTATVLLVMTQGACTGTCASLLLRLDEQAVFPGCSKTNAPRHAELLCGLPIICERVRSRLERKPAQPDHIAFETKTAWAR